MPHLRVDAIDDFIRILEMFGAGMEMQVAMDLTSLQTRTGRVLSSAARATFLQEQLRVLRRTFVEPGLVHPRVLATVERIRPSALPRLARLARRSR